MLKRLNLDSRGDEGKVATVRGVFTIPWGVQPVCTAMPLGIAIEQGTCLLSSVPHEQAAIAQYVQNGSPMVRKWFANGSGVVRVWFRCGSMDRRRSSPVWATGRPADQPAGRPTGRSAGRSIIGRSVDRPAGRQGQMVRKWFANGSQMVRVWVWCGSCVVRV